MERSVTFPVKLCKLYSCNLWSHPADCTNHLLLPTHYLLLPATYLLYLQPFFTDHFRVGRVIPDRKKELRVNRRLLRNCNPALVGKPDTCPGMKTMLSQFEAVVRIKACRTGSAPERGTRACATLFISESIHIQNVKGNNSIIVSKKVLCVCSKTTLAIPA